MYLFVFFLSLMLYTSFGHAVLYFSPNVQARGVQLQLDGVAGWAGRLGLGRGMGDVRKSDAADQGSTPRACIATNVFTHGRQHCLLPYRLLQAAQGLGATILVVLDIFKGGWVVFEANKAAPSSAGWLKHSTTPSIPLLTCPRLCAAAQPDGLVVALGLVSGVVYSIPAGRGPPWADQ